MTGETTFNIVCAVITSAAFIYIIYRICAKIVQIEILLYQQNMMLDLHQMEIDLLDADMKNDQEKKRTVKEQFEKYCTVNGLVRISDCIAEMKGDK